MLKHPNQTSFKKGHIPWIKGRHLSPMASQKLRERALKPESIAQSIANLPQGMSGASNPNWRGGRYINCVFCNQQFWVSPSRLGTAKYCSRVCKDSALNIHGKRNPNWRGGHYKNCEHCGSPFWVQPSREKKRHYCSLSCKAKAEGVFRRLNNDLGFQQKRLKAAIKQPNKQEQRLATLLDNWHPMEWKFVGDGEVILGKLNPDFINCDGKKQIIELFGCWWHGCPIHHPEKRVNWKDTEIGRGEIYSRYGFKTLIIWEHELEDKGALKGKVTRFSLKQHKTGQGNPGDDSDGQGLGEVKSSGVTDGHC